MPHLASFSREPRGQASPGAEWWFLDTTPLKMSLQQRPRCSRSIVCVCVLILPSDARQFHDGLDSSDTGIRSRVKKQTHSPAAAAAAERSISSSEFSFFDAPSAPEPSPGLQPSREMDAGEAPPPPTSSGKKEGFRAPLPAPTATPPAQPLAGSTTNPSSPLPNFFSLSSRPSSGAGMPFRVRLAC